MHKQQLRFLNPCLFYCTESLESDVSFTLTQICHMVSAQKVHVSCSYSI